MKKIRRRDKLKIFGDLLSALNDQSKTEKIVLTRVQAQINAPFDRLKNYISELISLGLVKENI